MLTYTTCATHTDTDTNTHTHTHTHIQTHTHTHTQTHTHTHTHILSFFFEAQICKYPIRLILLGSVCMPIHLKLVEGLKDGKN